MAVGADAVAVDAVGAGVVVDAVVQEQEPKFITNCMIKYQVIFMMTFQLLFTWNCC